MPFIHLLLQRAVIEHLVCTGYPGNPQLSAPSEGVISGGFSNAGINSCFGETKASTAFTPGVLSRGDLPDDGQCGLGVVRRVGVHRSQIFPRLGHCTQ
jgi:hypothetical protein